MTDDSRKELVKRLRNNADAAYVTEDNMRAHLREAASMIEALVKERGDARRERTDGLYFIEALVGMLGPLGKKVWSVWQTKKVTRIHHDWGPEAPHGEDRAAFLLDLEERLKTATKVEFPERVRVPSIPGHNARKT